MIASIIGFIIALIFRILMGYLAERFTFLESWLIYITIFVCAIAGCLALLIIGKIVKAFSGVKKNKKEDQEEK